MSQQFYFSPHILDNLVPPEAGFDVVQDMAQPRLRMYVTARGIKTFFTRRRVGGRDSRVIIGRYPDMDVDAARMAVSEYSAAPAGLESGPRIRNPKSVSEIFGRLAGQYLREKVRRAPASRDKLKRAIRRHFAPIMNTRVDKITTADLQRLCDGIAQNSGAATANRMRDVLIGIFKLLPRSQINPAREVNPAPESRRRMTLTAAGMRKILRAAAREKSLVLSAAFQMMVFGFAPRSKIFSMRWDDINFNYDTWGNAPLTDAAIVLLRSLPQVNQWVFPGNFRRPLTDPRTSWRRLAAGVGMPGLQMGDIYKFMSKRAAWSPDMETLRAARNAAVEEITG